MMKKPTSIVLAGVLGLGLLLGVGWRAGWWGGLEEPVIKDLDAYRTNLQQQVSAGRITSAEAQVKYAEALARARTHDRRKAGGQLKAKAKNWTDEQAREFEALGKRLMEQVEQGELTAQEAKKRWRAAVQKSGSNAKSSKAGAGSQTDKSARTPSAEANGPSKPAPQ